MAVNLALINPKSPTNVGAVLRAAGCFAAERIFYTGQRFQRANKFHTDTKRRSSEIPLQYSDDILQDCPEGSALVCVELVEGATPLPNFQHPENALYVFGPEDGSLSQDLVDAADAVVFIPTRGCLNLAASVNVLLYDRAAKYADKGANGATAIDPELGVLKNRDINNRLRVKHEH